MVVSRLALTSIVIAAIVAASDQRLASEEKSKQDSASTIRKTAADNNESGWSESVACLQARISFKHQSVFNGTPRVATFLHLRNTSDVINPMKFSWLPDKATYRVTDAAGKEIPRGSMNYSGPGQMSADLIIPYEGTLSFNISGQGLGIPGDMAAALDLGEHSYSISPEVGPCFLHVVIEIADDKKLDSPRSWHGRLELPPVAIPMKVEQPDPAKVEALIRKLGQQMVTGTGAKSEKARRELSLISDERVVPWYVKAIDTNDYELKFAALDRLSRFKGDEALRGLIKGMSTQAADIDNCSTEALAAQLAANIRVATAQALARSTHPEALALLKKMSEDPNQNVRTEAQQYLKLRGAKP